MDATIECIFYYSEFRKLTFIFKLIGLCLLDVLVVGGNLVVICASLTSKKLVSSITNSFVINLAFCDLFVGVFILPLSIVNEMLKKNWILNDFMCKFWLGTDVWLCTASILNLVVIGFDRFLAICQPLKYSKIMRECFGRILIALVWVISLLIALPSFKIVVLQNAAEKNSTGKIMKFNTSSDCFISKKSECSIITSGVEYKIYSALGSFFIPLIILAYLYAKIFLSIYRRTSNLHEDKEGSSKFTKHQETTNPISTEKLAECRQLAVPSADRQESCSSLICDSTYLTSQNYSKRSLSCSQTPTKGTIEYFFKRPKTFTSVTSFNGSSIQSSSSLNIQSQIKIAQMLGIICISFVVCWMPFFTIYILGIFVDNISETLADFFFWLGYCNSAINPIMYTMISQEYRLAFKELLCGQPKSKSNPDLMETTIIKII